MPALCARRPQFRRKAHAVGWRALVGTIAGALWIGAGHAANDDEASTLPPHHPYLAPAPSLAEMATGGPVERAIADAARILFPELDRGILPATEFGVIVLPSFWSPYVVLFREADGGMVVEKREPEWGILLRDLTPDEAPRITTESKLLHPEIATASVSAIRRALANARPNRPMIDGDGREWVVLDGVSFYFFSRDSAGSAHSPDPATEAGQLVELASVLRQFVDDQADERELRMAAENALRANHGSPTEES